MQSGLIGKLVKYQHKHGHKDWHKDWHAGRVIAMYLEPAGADGYRPRPIMLVIGADDVVRKVDLFSGLKLRIVGLATIQ